MYIIVLCIDLLTNFRICLFAPKYMNGLIVMLVVAINKLFQSFLTVSIIFHVDNITFYMEYYSEDFLLIYLMQGDLFYK